MSVNSSFNVDLASINEIVIRQASIENKTALAKLSDKVHFNVTFGFIPGINVDLKKFRIVFTCTITAKGENDQLLDVRGTFDVLFLFHIDNIDELVTITNNEVAEIDESLIASIANIVYSTSRGIIYTRCLGTIMEKFILPVISTDKLREILMPNKEG
jgi:hypothetical protein